MAVWTGYSNRLTPIVGDGFLVAAKVYRSMISYLSEDDQPGDWTMPDGLFRNGEFVFRTTRRTHMEYFSNTTNTNGRNLAQQLKVQLHRQVRRLVNNPIMLQQLILIRDKLARLFNRHNQYNQRHKIHKFNNHNSEMKENPEKQNSGFFLTKKLVS